MKRIIYLPLDERPCNASFPVTLFSDAMEIAVPPALGSKKTPANWEQLQHFLEQEAPRADGMVLAMDQLLYGGLIPSRLHHLERDEVRKRLNFLRTLKKRYPALVIYAYQCIMRCPQYSSSEEEPDYYAQYGREIFLLGKAQHKVQLGLCREEELNSLRRAVPEEALKDYLERRAFNLSFNLEALELVRDGVIDGLVFPQDDSAAFGFTAMDQEKVRARIREMRLDTKVMLYPGADELGLTTMSRMLLYFEGRHPRVYVKMASVIAAGFIPPYEDRPLGETIKYHLIAAGCRVASSLEEADIVLGVTFPGCEGREITDRAAAQREYDITRNLAEFLLFLEDALESGKIVTVADNAYANGGDPDLISQMDQRGLLDRIHGYAGWNTSSNTMGTAVAEGIHALIRGMTNSHRSFIALRYVEDAGYCGKVRSDVAENDLPRLNYTYYDVGEQRGEVSRIVGGKLREYAAGELSSIADRIEIQDVWMPWERAFEVGLKIQWKE